MTNYYPIEFVVPGPTQYSKLTISATNPQEAQDLLEAVELQGLYALFAGAIDAARQQGLLNAELGAVPAHAPVAQVQQAYPQQAPQTYAQQAPQQPQGPQAAATPPGLTPPSCPHGLREYVNGKYGPFWGCPGFNLGVPKEQRCKPQKVA